MDWPLSLDRAVDAVDQFGRDGNHPFLPFIKSSICTPRYKKDPITKKRTRSKKSRPIMYAAHRDAAILSAYSRCLSDKYESYIAKTDFSGAILAYRSLGFNNVDFANRAFHHIAQNAPCVAYSLDIKGFFDNLDHVVLKKNIIKVLSEEGSRLSKDWYSIYSAITKFSWIELDDLVTVLDANGTLLTPKGAASPYCRFGDLKLLRERKFIQKNRKPCGIPQGSPISAVLSNVYMLEFDRYVNDICQEKDAIYLRYSDDILIVSKNHEAASFIYSEIENGLKENGGLVIASEKTIVSHFMKNPEGLVYSDRALQYLGFKFDGQSVRIRSSSLSKHRQKMARTVKRARHGAKKNKDRDFAIRLRKIYGLYSHLAKKKSFYSYIRGAERKLQRKNLRRQVRKNWERLHQLIRG